MNISQTQVKKLLVKFKIDTPYVLKMSGNLVEIHTRDQVQQALLTHADFTEIPGIGERIAAILQTKYRTLDELNAATDQELCSLQHISKSKLAAIRSYMKGRKTQQ